MTDREETAKDVPSTEDSVAPAPADGRDADTQPRPSGKKRKKRRMQPAAGGVVDAARDGWPAFARSFPRDAALERLVEAFERGNYALVRAGAERLVKSTDEDDVRRAARELVRRTRPDPLAVGLLVAAFGLLAFLSLWYWSHAHGAP